MCRLVVLFVVVFADKILDVDSCRKGDLVNNISDGFKSGTAIIKDNVRYESNNYYIEDYTIWGCICEVTKCLRKCCEDGQFPVKAGVNRVCKPSPTDQHILMTYLGENEHTKDYRLFHAGFICDTPNSIAMNKTNLEQDLNDSVFKAYGMSLGVKNFCLDYVHNKLTSIICVVTEEEQILASVVIECYDVCNPDKLVQSNITSYKYKQEPIQKCACLDPDYCVKKCCAKGYNIERKRCVMTTKQEFSLPIFSGSNPLRTMTPDNYYVGVLKHCDFYPRFPVDPEDKFYLQENLSLYLVDEQDYVTPENYCLEYTTTGDLIAILCISEANPPLSVKINYVGMIISMPFLLVTFIVYALLPDRNLHMKALMCYVINLLHAYIFLVTIQLTEKVFEDTICAILGFCCIFFFLASFFWMNVICVDIFLGFRGFRGGPGVRSSERKRFILYCIYAWGMSFLIIFITYMVNHFGNVGQWFYPGVAVGQCFLRSGIPELLYFYGPMGVIIILNVVLFTLTALRIRGVKKDTAMLKHGESKRHSDDEQQNFNLYLKLLLAMGVNWSMELVSWAVNQNNKSVPQYVWYLSDFCNATYGVFIFFIFVFKRNIWTKLRRRYYSFMGRHHLAHSMGTTNFTKTTNDSMTVSTNDRLEESELHTSRIN